MIGKLLDEWHAKLAGLGSFITTWLAPFRGLEIVNKCWEDQINTAQPRQNREADNTPWRSALKRVTAVPSTLVGGVDAVLLIAGPTTPGTTDKGLLNQFNSARRWRNSRSSLLNVGFSSPS